MTFIYIDTEFSFLKHLFFLPSYIFFCVSTSAVQRYLTQTNFYLIKNVFRFVYLQIHHKTNI